MKKSIIAVACVIGLTMGFCKPANAEINEKVKQSFHTVFSKAKEVKWTEYADHYFVSFKQYGVDYRINYDLKGNILNSIRYYEEAGLPLKILCEIKKTYHSKTIDGVTEVSNQNGLVYMVHLKDNKEFLLVKAHQNGLLEEVQRFDNANQGDVE